MAKGHHYSEPVENAALSTMILDTEKESHPALKQFMEDFLLNFAQEAEVLPSVVRDFHWSYTVSKERELITIFPVDLYVDIERLLSKHVYSGYARNSVVRYPLTIAENRPGKRATKNVDKETASPSKMLNSHYNFGSNTYQVGRAIEELLNFLKDRYSLQIEDLEQEYQKRKRLGKR